jgi:peptide/nickel transport system substrate-binding protein
VEDRSRTELELLTRLAGRMTRRDVLKRAAALGLSAPVIASLLAACGGSSDKATATKSAATAATGGGGSTPAAGASATSGGAQPTTSSGGGTTGDTFVIGRAIDDLITMDIGHAYEVSSGPILWAAYQALVAPNKQDITKFDPVLATEIPTKDNGGISADGLTYTFKLRQGVKFHTGKEMKADDWVFSLKRLHFLTDNPSFLADPYTKKVDPNDPTKDVVQVEKVDDYTIKFTLVEPNVAFLAYLSSTSNSVYDSEFVKAHGGLDDATAAKNDTA